MCEQTGIFIEVPCFVLCRSSIVRSSFLLHISQVTLRMEVSFDSCDSETVGEFVRKMLVSLCTRMVVEVHTSLSDTQGALEYKIHL